MILQLKTVYLSETAAAGGKEAKPELNGCQNVQIK